MKTVGCFSQIGVPFSTGYAVTRWAKSLREALRRELKAKVYVLTAFLGATARR